MLFDNKKDIFELMDKFGESPLSELEISAGGQHIKLSKSAKAAVFENMPVSKAPESLEPYGGGYGISDDADDQKLIKAPLVGTFYSSPSPESPAYVKVGDKVAKGMVLCIIEAMKTMNDIESETDGEIAEVLAKNGQPVEYGQPLFRLK
jgi:acetyl-CoA carboxylase biotin carboxyl carrier protein